MARSRSSLFLAVSVFAAIVMGVALPVTARICPSILAILLVIAGLMMLVSEAAAVGWVVIAGLAVMIALGVTILIAVFSVFRAGGAHRF